jgi:hypothetical protein
MSPKMKILIAIAIVAILALIVLFSSVTSQVGGGDPSRGSKCFSCEAQDAAMGIDRDYGTKCVSCEIQDRDNGIHCGYGSKWF